MRTKKDNRRYYLHQKIKTSVRYNPRKKLIEIPVGTEISNDGVSELSKNYNYSIQTYIPL